MMWPDFFHLPSHGLVKEVIEDKCMITNIFIYISYLISLLSHPPRSPPVDGRRPEKRGQ